MAEISIKEIAQEKEWGGRVKRGSPPAIRQLAERQGWARIMPNIVTKEINHKNEWETFYLPIKMLIFCILGIGVSFIKT